jgi:sensor histidine kinase regulating citrate/malate metabolism
MSKTYDALIKAEKIARSTIAFSQRQRKNPVSFLSLGWHDFNLEWKLMGIIASTLLVFGLLFAAIVNQLMGRALRAQIDQRALLMATNLSDAAAGHVMGRNTLELHVLVTKYARLTGAAYAFIEDGKGQIIAHSFGSFPQELKEDLTIDDRRQVNRRVVKLPASQGKTVYETRAPILEGQMGAAHIGLWGDGVATEIYSALFPMVGLITILLLAGVSVSVFLARGVIRPIRWVTEMAGKMSRGDLETAVQIDSRDEIGELARSLERMRVSLKYFSDRR